MQINKRKPTIIDMVRIIDGVLLFAILSMASSSK